MREDAGAADQLELSQLNITGPTCFVKATRPEAISGDRFVMPTSKPGNMTLKSTV